MQAAGDPLARQQPAPDEGDGAAPTTPVEPPESLTAEDPASVPGASAKPPAPLYRDGGTAPAPASPDDESPTAPVRPDESPAAAARPDDETPAAAARPADETPAAAARPADETPMATVPRTDGAPTDLPSPDDDATPPALLPSDAGATELAAAAPPPRPPTTIERLRDGMMTDRLWGWVVTLTITGIAFVIRLVNLGYPTNKLVFDETYYAKDGWTLWKFGYETNWPEGANDKILIGNTDSYLTAPEFVVHPPLGKWLIGLGEQWFGMNSFGWRFLPLVFGTLLVFFTIRMARRLSRSTLVGALAGVLLTLDGLAFVMSRMALLDIFEATFIVAAVSALVADRDWFRHRLADRLEASGKADLGGAYGPIIWLRPWRLAAGLSFGLALGVKWNALYALAAFGVLCVLWDVGARRLAGADFRAWLALVVEGIPAFVRLVVVAALVYVATWTGWLVTEGGYRRDWGAQNPDEPWTKALGEAFGSLLYLHKEIYEFHIGDYIRNATHPYDAHPAGWLVMARPIGMDAVNDIQPGTDGCLGPDNCIRVISGMGTPILWWFAAIALVVCIIWWIGGRDWRFGVPVVGALCTYLPWFNYADRPLFFFYAITIIPFTVTGLAMVLGLILGDPKAPDRRRRAIIVGVATALVAANFAWIYPVLTDELLPYPQWLARMWLRTWI